MPDSASAPQVAAEREARLQLALDARTSAIASAVFVPVPGGLSNFCWHALQGDAQWFVRLSRTGTEQLGADHANECRILSLAADAGLAPRVLRCDPPARILVTQWIVEATGKPGAGHTAPLDGLARMIANLHAMPAPRDLRTVDFAVQARLLEHASGGIEPALQATAFAALHNLHESQAPLVLCHNDLNPLNIVVDQQQRTWLVDWEYAGLGDVVFDLASCVSQHDFTAAQCDRFLASYESAGGVCDRRRFELACWAFDYVQWLWYTVFGLQATESERAPSRQRAARLAQLLHERARDLPHCNN
jgi:aminoglycoside phosphotransferase (APT) family kinase protein